MTTKVKTKTIPLGYNSIYNWTPKSKLFSDWMYEEDEYKEEIESLSENEVILPPYKEYLLTITYPLTNPYQEVIKSKKQGLTRKEVFELIVNRYKLIYNKEAETTKEKEGKISGMFNRNKTDGQYGIWGHDLSDLVLHSLYIKGNNLTVGVDS